MLVLFLFHQSIVADFVGLGWFPLGKELQSRQPKKPAGGVRINQQSSGSGATQPKKSQGGTFGGDVDVGDDF